MCQKLCLLSTPFAYLDVTIIAEKVMIPFLKKKKS